MGILIDFILIATFVLAVWSGTKRGFIRSLMNIITFVAALLCGWYFYPPVAAVYNNRFMLNKFTADVYNSIKYIISSGIESLDISRLFADKPDAFLDVIQRYNADFDIIENYYNKQVISGSEDVLADISARIAEPTAAGISEILAFITIFLGVVILLKIVTLILDLIFKLPVLNAFNRIAGFILGSVCGLAYAWILSIVITAALPFLAVIFPAVFTQTTQDNSLILNFINNLRN